MNVPVATADIGPRIGACDGAGLRIKILAQLRNPLLESATFISFRYNDFDFLTGKVGGGGNNALVELATKAALNGARIRVITRDPFSDADGFATSPAFKNWYLGIGRMVKAQIDVGIHPTLHSKLYLFKQNNERRFYAIGSSNLTAQGLGFGWLECNAFGYHRSDYLVLDQAAGRISEDRRIEDWSVWDRRCKRRVSYARLAHVD